MTQQHTTSMLQTVDEGYTYCRLFEGRDHMVRLSSWENGAAIAEFIDGEWVPHDDSYMIVLGEDRKFTDNPYVDRYQRNSISVSHEVWVHFKNTVPEEIQKIVERFRYSQLQILKALRYCPELIELAQSCLLLFWLIVQYAKANNHIGIKLCSLIRQKRRKILTCLGFGNSETSSAVRFLSKINIPLLIDEDLFCITDILRSEEKLMMLRHYELITKTHLMAVSDYSHLLKYGFIRSELSQDISPGTFKRLADLFNDTCNIGEILQKGNLEDFFRNCRSGWHLERFHDSLVEEMDKEEIHNELTKRLAVKYGNIIFPPPPVLGNKHIRPILSLASLKNEGKILEHCIFSFAEEIFKKKCFCYKILNPERGTLLINLKNGTPVIGAIHLKKNNPPSPETIKSVNEWLEIFMKTMVREETHNE
ncbi:MAG: PcfJ domain-containing protein [Pseudomonadota bacterium]